MDNIIQRIESELLSLLIKYASKDKILNAQTKADEIFAKNKQDTDFNQLKKQKLKNQIFGIEKIILDSFEKSNVKTSNIGNLLVHEFESERKTEDKSEISFAVSYFSGKKDELKAEISGKSKYSIETENENPWNEPYGLIVHYERKNGTERVSISYYEQADNYLAKHIMEKEDMSLRVSLKFLNLLPKSQMGGILGFTYLGDNSMGRRDDLTGGMARMVDIHESIHTPDEYETKVITDWILEKPLLKYKK